MTSLVFLFCLIISFPVSNFCFDRICINVSGFFLFYSTVFVSVIVFLFVTFSSTSDPSQLAQWTIFPPACSLFKSHIYVTNIDYNFICFNYYLNAKNMAFRTLTILVFIIIFFYLICVSTSNFLLLAHFFFVCFCGHFVSKIVKWVDTHVGQGGYTGTAGPGRPG